MVSFNYSDLPFNQIKPKKTTIKTQNNYEKILQHIKTTPNFSKYSIAKLLDVTPATALSYLNKMEKLKLIKEGSLDTAKTISMIIDDLQREKQILDILKKGVTDKKEIFKQLNLDEKMIGYFNWAIRRLSALGVIHFNSDNNVSLIKKDVEEFYKQLEKCKQQIIEKFKEHKFIKVQGILYIYKFNQSMVEQAMNELIIEGKIKKHYNVNDPYKKIYSLDYYEYCSDNSSEFKDNISGDEFFREKNFGEKESEYQLYVKNEIMKILYNSKSTEEELKAKITKNDEFKFPIFIALMQLEEEGSIKYQIENHNGKRQTFIYPKKTSNKWLKEAEIIQTKILNILSNVDFVSREYLLQLLKNKKLFQFVIGNLESQQKIIESRKLMKKQVYICMDIN